MSDGPVIRTVRENLVFESPYLRVWNDDVEFPDGTAGQYARTRFTAPHGVAALPVWRGQVLLIRNYRYAEKMYSVEVPMGFGEAGQTPEADMQRELGEEVGTQAATLTPLGHTGHGYRCFYFIAHMPETFEYSASGAEGTEAFGPPVIAKIGTRPERLIEEHGIFDAHTQILLLRLGLLVRDGGPGPL